MTVKLACAVVLMCGVTACGGDSTPSSPLSPSPAPAPSPPVANIVTSGQFAFKFDESGCLPNPYIVAQTYCRMYGALQNTGTGCAAQTSAVVRFSGILGVGLAARVLRPGEIVSVGMVQSIGRGQALAVTGYLVLPTWTNVAC